MLPNILSIQSDQSEIKEQVLSYLRGSVFHVTNEKGFNGIMKSKAILNNKDNRFEYTFPQSKGSYGINRGYICFFDFRKASLEDIEETILRFDFIHHKFRESNPHYFLLRKEYHDEVISCDIARKDVAYSEMWIPETECWFPRDVPITYIDIIIKLHHSNP
jgi:hypothetical protein